MPQTSNKSTPESESDGHTNSDFDTRVTNSFGVSLAEIQQVSRPLRELLATTDQWQYDSAEAADAAAVSKLRYWRFSDDDIVDILEMYRTRKGRGREHFQSVVQRTELSEISPVSPSLGQAILRSAKQNNGRPEAGVTTFSEIQLCFQLLGDELTITEIVDSDFVTWGNATRESVARRISRGLSILVDANYVSWTRAGRTIVYQDEGVSSLTLPNYPLSVS